jgi:hypothetical protein
MSPHRVPLIFEAIDVPKLELFQIGAFQNAKTEVLVHLEYKKPGVLFVRMVASERKAIIQCKTSSLC